MRKIVREWDNVLNEIILVFTFKIKEANKNAKV